uniref:Secreted protein n=1 Tax=Macrostomum lignano TaxID=282301 RepID=A0A1I8FM95_9PLAT
CWLDPRENASKTVGPATIELILLLLRQVLSTRSAPVGGRIHQISVRSANQNAIWSTACCPALRTLWLCWPRIWCRVSDNCLLALSGAT